MSRARRCGRISRSPADRATCRTWLSAKRPRSPAGLSASAHVVRRDRAARQSGRPLRAGDRHAAAPLRPHAPDPAEQLGGHRCGAADRGPRGLPADRRGPVLQQRVGVSDDRVVAGARLQNEDRGATAVEYGLLVAGIALSPEYIFASLGGAPDQRGSMSVLRALTAAPCLRSDLITRMRSMLTAMNSSLTCQLATCTAACSGRPQLLFAPLPPSVPTSRACTTRARISSRGGPGKRITTWAP